MQTSETYHGMRGKERAKELEKEKKRPQSVTEYSPAFQEMGIH